MIRAPEPTPFNMTVREFQELEIFLDLAIKIQSQAKILAIIEPTKYSEMSSYLDRLRTDIECYYKAHKPIEVAND